MVKKLISALIALVMICSTAFTVGTVSFADGEFPFTDVPEGAWYADGAKYCYKNGYMTGVSETRFAPDLKLTRAQLYLVLFKASGETMEETPDMSGVFTDVPAGAWYAKGVKWACDNKITSGTGDGTTFSPDMAVTRETLALVFRQYSKYMGFKFEVTALLNYYKDAHRVSEWAKDGVLWAIDFGLISGTGEATLSPKMEVTRAQLSLILMKFIQFTESDCEHEWTNPSCTEGRVCTKCGYTRGTPNGHSTVVTCTHGGKCRVCGETVIALGHDLDRPRTCTQSAKCLRCGETFEALGHEFVNEKCKRCGAAQFKNKAEKLKYYLKKNGELDKDADCYLVEKYIYHNDLYTYNCLSYLNGSDKFILDFTWFFEDDSMYHMEIDMPSLGGWYDITCMQVSKEGDIHLIGETKSVHVSEITKDFGLKFGKYYLVGTTAAEKRDLEHVFSLLLTEGLYSFKSTTSGKSVIGGITLEDLGFTSFK